MRDYSHVFSADLLSMLEDAVAAQQKTPTGERGDRISWMRSELHERLSRASDATATVAAFDAWCAVEDDSADEGESFERLYHAIDVLRVADKRQGSEEP